MKANEFEEYMATTGMDEQTENSCAWKFYKELYRVGQQSKQAEIDKLKMSNHYLSVQVLDAEAYSDYWKKNHDRLQAEIDALKAELAKHQREGYKLVPEEPTEEMLNVRITALP